jgi:hypothetical protein
MNLPHRIIWYGVCTLSVCVCLCICYCKSFFYVIRSITRNTRLQQYQSRSLHHLAAAYTKPKTIAAAVAQIKTLKPSPLRSPRVAATTVAPLESPPSQTLETDRHVFVSSFVDGHPRDQLGLFSLSQAHPRQHAVLEGLGVPTPAVWSCLWPP